jgi:hypothetical protein
LIYWERRDVETKDCVRPSQGSVEISRPRAFAYCATQSAADQLIYNILQLVTLATNFVHRCQVTNDTASTAVEC